MDLAHESRSRERTIKHSATLVYLTVVGLMTVTAMLIICHLIGEAVSCCYEASRVIDEAKAAYKFTCHDEVPAAVRSGLASAGEDDPCRVLYRKINGFVILHAFDLFFAHEMSHFTALLKPQILIPVLIAVVCAVVVWDRFRPSRQNDSFSIKEILMLHPLFGSRGVVDARDRYRIRPQSDTAYAGASQTTDEGQRSQDL